MSWLGGIALSALGGALGEWNEKEYKYDSDTKEFTTKGQREAAAAALQAKREHDRELARQRNQADIDVDKARRIGQNEANQKLIDEAPLLGTLYSQQAQAREAYGNTAQIYVDRKNLKLVINPLPLTDAKADARITALNSSGGAGDKLGVYFYKNYNTEGQPIIEKGDLQSGFATAVAAQQAGESDLKKFGTGWSYEITSDDGRYFLEYAKQKVFRTRSDAEKDAQAENKKLTGTALRAVVESDVNSDGETVYSTVVRSLPKEKDDSSAPDPLFEDSQKIPYAGMRTYYHRKEFGKDVGKKGDELYELVVLREGGLPGYSYPFDPAADNEVLPEDMKFGVDYVFRLIPSESEGNEEKAVRALGTTYTPQVVRRILEMRESNKPRTREIGDREFNKMISAAKAVAKQWSTSSSGSEQVEGRGRTFYNISMASDWFGSVSDMHPDIRQAFKDDRVLQTAISEVQQQDGVSLSSFGVVQDTGDVFVPNLENLAQSNTAGIESRDSTTDRAVNPQFISAVEQAVAKTEVQAYDLLYAFDTARVGNPNGSGTTTGPLAVDAAVKGYQNLRKFLNEKDDQGINKVSFVIEQGGQSVITPPDLGRGSKQLMAGFLAPFATVTDQITVMQASLPPLVQQQADSFQVVSDVIGPELLYTTLTGNTSEEYKALGQKAGVAGRLQSATEASIQLIEEGAELGFESDITLVQNFFKRVGDVFTTSESRVGKIFSSDSGQTIFEDDAARQRAIEGLEQLRETANDQAVSEDRRKDALLKYHLSIAAYTYASMLDPNGRLSDRDIIQAENAIAAFGRMADPSIVAKVLVEMHEAAAKQKALSEKYKTGRPRTIVAAHMVEKAHNIESPSLENLLAKYQSEYTESIRTRTDGLTPQERDERLRALGRDSSGEVLPASPDGFGFEDV